MTHEQRSHLPHYKLLRTLQECKATCDNTTTMILSKPDLQFRTNQLRLLRDCVDMCDLTEKLVARHSPFTKRILSECAYVCDACANECLKFPDMESQRCAQICLKCAEECRQHAMMM